ncbi:acyl-CoA thioester hydrolase [Onishia taeanensis]|jgi:acyl-CoA thioester hydrolase|uniref:Acyl-CoA thioester hydrolase n=1 Tax=Onishia taeanensis TaxID=284577 RepID=A0A1G7VDV8_9GAMM|nr:thioesterase family protein [Halomonas taeanensis]MAX31772.1 acyl-CoA thioesterase [Halomonadaceae bacterium]SDG57539.1 acyl-CoA thioester hydrolase [Halomonas taeanensis]
MFVTTLDPAFHDTDALGHINNTRLPAWFEQARTDLFRLFTPDLDPRKWQLILARLDVEFLAELHYGSSVEVNTFLTRLGNSSFTVTQEARQHGKLCARGNTVMVHYDHHAKRAKKIEGELRTALEEHLQAPAEAES